MTLPGDHRPVGPPSSPPDGVAGSAEGTNGAALDQAIEALRAALAARLAPGGPGAARSPHLPPLDALAPPPALAQLARRFGLSEFERSVLLLCAAHALDGRIGPLLAEVQGDAARDYPTFAVAMAVLPCAHWDAVTPAGSLRRWRLVELADPAAPLLGRLALDERVLHYVAGASYLDPRLTALVAAVDVEAEAVAAPGEAVSRVVAAWRAAGSALQAAVLEVASEESGRPRAVAAGACAALGLELHEVRAEELPVAPGEREPLQRLWARDALLAHSALYVDAQGVEGFDAAAPLASFLEGLPGLVVVGTRAPLLRLRRACQRLDLAPPTAAEAVGAWRHALGSLAVGLNGEVGALAGQFRLTPQEIASAGARSAARCGTAGPERFAVLWGACREQARGGLDQLAARVEARAGWEALVLPPAPLQALRLIALQVRHQSTVHERWGFRQAGQRGLGLSALFSGPSGTGKTLAAEVLARELSLDLYRIDLSALVSKWVGETEKNLRRVFDAADASGAILLFDEADAVFGRRGEVRDGHDRYANLEVSYLLQRMEAYRGLAILTTNLEEAIDQAFLRRIRFVVQFPFPEAAQRAEIWRRVFPDALPRQGLDLERLARLHLSGGSIRNLALNAAFLAAEDDQPLGMHHLAAAAEAEYAKLGKARADDELGDGA